METGIQGRKTLDDANAIDMQYIKPVLGDVCGPQNTRLLYYRNVHPTLRIKITVHHHWVYEGQEYHQYPVYVLEPNPRAGSAPTELDQFMGCPIPGPTMQQFYWDVLKAERA